MDALVVSHLVNELTVGSQQQSLSSPSSSAVSGGFGTAAPYALLTLNQTLGHAVAGATGTGGSDVLSVAIASTTATAGSITSSTVPGKALEHEPEIDTIRKVIICIVLLVVIFGTIVGNILVCVAVCLVRKLRRPCNYLLVSLAVSDLCVACLVMPPALMYEVLGEWNFGRVFCDIWVSFDVLSCTASILNLCAISVDRYWAITKPLEYGVKRTPRRMMLCVALVWLAAACISLPPLLILGNKHTIGEGSDQRPFCAVCEDVGYQIYATLGSFYIPLAVMLFVYYQIFRAARRIVKDEKRAQTRLENSLAVDKNQAMLKPPEPVVNNSTGSPHQKKLRFQLAKERKASTTLGIIMSAFTICWLPFFILALVRPLMDDDYPTLSSFFLWLGYANSLLNPIIYATLNRDFRKPFQEILYFRCSNLNILMREDFYHSQYGEPGSQRFVLDNEGQHTARESFL
ncbi:5-hydroxytryptamine receptor 1-like [Toxorhynchites rutilus septentrionalis]|uniref:5-hydroxytryptamine receptor 1-like n=1 Tax=Toxorhynchites rutilus septentrionalis TaxID=329112 RepID=UPI00247A91DE|nr:5-hydroxytryptamine receptor 1-like [Toxorhynchites rutilus septentrionalis]XP_055619113.1 5-hydroxytryptamine receptor 1-like [Toxorhynchites rutilus septentrionalis]XP_055619122.1 5-hydroxytryptamine receptor 1-like [Toxorhynchites rutilus septentrionalis]XP_055619131.1 5-hydroxytryptamine receptor 1-like [Toxorhynchites rutilus septentrionalis]